MESGENVASSLSSPRRSPAVPPKIDQVNQAVEGSEVKAAFPSIPAESNEEAAEPDNGDKASAVSAGEDLGNKAEIVEEVKHDADAAGGGEGEGKGIDGADVSEVHLLVEHILDTLVAKEKEGEEKENVQVGPKPVETSEQDGVPELEGSSHDQQKIDPGTTRDGQIDDSSSVGDEQKTSNNEKLQQVEQDQPAKHDVTELDESYGENSILSKTLDDEPEVENAAVDEVGETIEEDTTSAINSLKQGAEETSPEVVEEKEVAEVEIVPGDKSTDETKSIVSPPPRSVGSPARLSIKRKWNKQHYASPKVGHEPPVTETNHSHQWELDERNHAASVIQGAYRAASQRFASSVQQDSTIMENSAVDIQRVYRGYVQRRLPLDAYFEESVDQTIAAIEIQRAMRGRLARDHVQTRRRERVAATEVQRLVRGRQTRRNFQKERENEAALRAQKRIRIYQAKQRRRDLELVREKQLEAASRKIQKEIRKYLSGRGAHSGLHARATAATTIQARFRGYQTRENMHNRGAAATRVQAHVRGHQERNLQKHRDESATKAQACFRGHIDRCARHQAKSAAICIQSQYRGCISRRDVAEKQQAATKVQTKYRGYKARKDAEEVSQNTKAATDIQRTFRGKQCREWIDECNRSAVNLQRVVRGHQHRCICQTRLAERVHDDVLESSVRTNTFVTCADSSNSFTEHYYAPKLDSTALAITASKPSGMDRGIQTESNVKCCGTDSRQEDPSPCDQADMLIGVDQEGQVSILSELSYVQILVGMRKFSVLRKVFMRYPQSLIGRILSGQETASTTRQGYLEFRRSGKLFQHILDFYYNRELSVQVRQDEVLRAAVEAEALYFDLHAEMFVPESTRPVVIRKNFERWLRLNGSAVQFQVRPHERLEVVSVQGSGVLLMNLIANDTEVIPEAAVFDTASIVLPANTEKIHLDMPPYPGGDDFMYSFIVAPCVQASSADGAAWLKVEFSIHISV